MRHFREVAETRMSDVPIINPAVEVEAIGFSPTEKGLLGVLVTPWFINLVLLPMNGEDWQECQVGTEVTHAFASGRYVFHFAGDREIGIYQTCSLLSPVLELADHATAVAVGHAALLALHDEAERDHASDTRAGEIARRWNGEDTAGESRTESDATREPTQQTRLSRRAFIGGRLLDNDAQGQ